MSPFHPDLVAAIHRDRLEQLSPDRRSPRRGRDARWVRPGRAVRRLAD
jgi:hypothetical protein